jgi:hypothetical protein
VVIGKKKIFKETDKLISCMEQIKGRRRGRMHRKMGTPASSVPC